MSNCEGKEVKESRRIERGERDGVRKRSGVERIEEEKGQKGTRETDRS